MEESPRKPLICHGRPALVLAPMEGVTDAPMRALLGERGGFDFCVGEFLRISQEVPPARVFYDHLPELKTGCLTNGGVPVQLQLLGGDAERMARSALLACQLGATAVDINFGCPAPTVNRHDGGAAILRYPCRVEEIVRAVREAVPAEIPVSAKLRLGWESVRDIHLNAEKAASGGASWITIHARTKTQGYAPPVDWHAIAEVKRNQSIPVVANGDIWTREDFERCREITRCEHFMIGRSALVDPTLPLWISHQLKSGSKWSAEELATFGTDPLRWKEILHRFSELCQAVIPQEGYTVRRIKQWLKMASLRLPIDWFHQVKTTQTLNELFLALK